MHKAEVTFHLERINEANEAYRKARREKDEAVERMMARLLHEAARHRMSVQNVAALSGYTPARIRSLMRALGLDPWASRTLLAAKAEEALVGNAALLGIDPRDFDLTSPLAYLPMGEEMRRQLQDQTISQVTEVERDEEDVILDVAYMLWQFKQGYVLAEDREVTPNWFREDPDALHPDDLAERPAWIESARKVVQAVRDLISGESA